MRKKPLFSARLALTLGLPLVFSGCAVGPDFQRPESALPEQYPLQDTALAAREAPAVNPAVNPEWWSLFQDAELNRLIGLALENNQDLQAAIARMEAAEAAAREAGADYFPSVDLQGASTRTRTSGDTASGRQMGSTTSTNRRVALGIGYELDLWGRIRRQNEAARAEALAGAFARDAVRLALTSQLAAEYLTLRVLDAELETTAETLQTREQTLKIVQSRKEAGVSSALDLAQAQGAHAAARAQWSQLRRQRGVSENLLGLITGQPDLQIAAGRLDLPLPPLPPAGLPSNLLEARPDVREAEERLVAANARIGVAKSAYFPSISLTGYRGSESADIANLFGAHSATIWSYGAALAMPIFNAGRTGARVDQATAAQQEALANYRKTVQNAFREVKDALVALRELTEEEEALSAQVEAAREAQRLSQTRYEAGYAGFLEVLDSQRTLNAAQLQEQTARRNHLAASIDLFRALGGGWRPTDGDAADGAAANGNPADDNAATDAKAVGATAADTANRS
jgi:multidrug efflux system outer membrane protein